MTSLASLHAILLFLVVTLTTSFQPLGNHDSHRSRIPAPVSPTAPCCVQQQQQQQQKRRIGTSSLKLAADESSSSSSKLPESYYLNRIDAESVTASDLRSLVFTDANGKEVSLGQAMGDNQTCVIVFLRHLGCTWCWSYVYQWLQVQNEIQQENMASPIFVSIGDPDRLTAFLEHFPDADPTRFFVDGYQFAGYQQAGFGRFDEHSPSFIESIDAKPIQLGGLEGWWTYFTNFAPLAPVTPDMKFPEMFQPEGLFWVGGTIVIDKNNDIVYRWNDRISGDHADVTEVLDLVKRC